MVLQLLALKERCRAIILETEEEEEEEKAGSARVVDESTAVKELKKKVKDLQDIVKQQDDIIQAAIFTERAGEKDLDDSRAEELEEERKVLRKERSELDEEWAEVERMKMGEFIDAHMAGALKEETGWSKGEARKSPMVEIGFEATPITTKILEDAGIRAVKEVKVKPEDLFD